MRNTALLAILPMLFCGCMNGHLPEPEPPAESTDHGLFICNEGNFQYGNGTLSYYDPETNGVTNEVFYRANGYKLGDVVQSMTIRDGLGWIVVNNSHVVFAIDTETFREVGRITGLTSPRYMCFVNDEKAYISQLWDNRIFVVNPRRYEITGYIEVPGMTMESGSTEQMIMHEGFVYCTCWSYQNRVIKIDTATDRVVGAVEVGIQPRSMVLDAENKLWTITDGGYAGSPYGTEIPRLARIDPATMTVERTFEFRYGQSPRELTLGGDRRRLYWLNDDVYCMTCDATELPDKPVIESRGTIYYGLTVSPYDGDIYVADAIDYLQNGVIYRYTSDGIPVSHFNVGVTPGAFCWK